MATPATEIALLSLAGFLTHYTTIRIYGRKPCRTMKKIIARLLYFGYHLFFKHFLNFQVYSYLTIGVFNTLWNIAMFHIFFYYLLAPFKQYHFFLIIPTHTISLIIAFILTAPLGFWLMRSFTFRKGTQSIRTQFVKYIYVLLQGLFLEFLILYSMVEFLHVEATLSKLCASALVAFLNFFLQQQFTFSRKKRKGQLSNKGGRHG